VCDRSEAMWMRDHIDQQLSQRERAVLWARVEGLSTREVADRLNISSKSAEAAFTRARAGMRLLTG
jgi:DNA-binding CsgD family transcriptional regulator